MGSVGSGTLLGPEGTAVGLSEGTARCWSAFRLPAPVDTRRVEVSVVMGGWSLFENCTVDASICGQVFKGARWMPWHQEPMKDVGGRDRPRGAVNQSFDPGVSEWGNPAVVMGCHPRLNT